MYYEDMPHGTLFRLLFRLYQVNSGVMNDFFFFAGVAKSMTKYQLYEYAWAGEASEPPKT